MLNNFFISNIKPHLAKIVTAAFALLLLTVETLLHPQISDFIEKQIRVQTAELGLDIDFSGVDYGYLPPNVTLKKITFKNDSTLASADQINLSLRVLPLFRGQVKAGHLHVEKLNASLQIQKKSKAEQANFPDLELNKIYKLIPIENILLSESKLILLQNEDVFSFEFDFLEFQKVFGKLQLETKSKVDLRSQNIKDNFLLNTKLRWQEKGFFISFFTLQKENSILQTSGFVNKEILDGDKIEPSLFYKNVTELRMSVNADLKDFSSLLVKLIDSKIMKQTKVKNFTGRLQASGYYFPDSKNGSADDKGSVKFKANDITTPFAHFKEIDFQGEVNTKTLSSDKFKIQFNERSSLLLDNLVIEQAGKAYSVSVDLKSDLIHIEDVIGSLNLAADNLRVPVSLDTHCGGSIQKDPILKCVGRGRVKSFDIFNSVDKGKLISTKDIGVDFSTYIRKDGLNFTSKLLYKDKKSNLLSNGQASGRVDYIKGFDVEFETTPLDLNFINTVSGLSFYGQTALKGSTQGSAKWGIFKADLINENFKLNKFFLGNSTGQISYNFPLLSVKGITGRILEYGNSYTGDLSLDVAQSSLDLNFLGQNVSDEGLRILFHDQFQLPEDIKFQSNLIVKAGGSTNIDRMDLDLKTKATEVDLFGEKFENSSIELSGENGQWSVTKGVFNKKNASITARGSFNGLKTMDVRLVSKNMSFEDSTFLKDLDLKLSGPLELTLNAKGPIEGPEAVGTLTANSTYGPNQNSIGKSSLGYRLFENEIFFKGDVFDRSFAGEGFYPLKPKGKLSLNGEFVNFDILNILNFNSENTKNTHLYLNGRASFSRKKNSSFQGDIENFKANLKTDQQQLLEVVQTGNGSFSKPISFRTVQKNDEASVNFDLSKADRKTMSFSGSLDISFLQPLIPTCEFISGKMKSDKLVWSRRNGIANSSGTARLDSANFKSDAFPYSFSKINSNLKTDGNTVLISDLTAFLSNTKIYGSGKIQSSQPASINLNFNYKNLNLEFPDKVFTTSDGRFNLSGESIPLGISGNLLVKEGTFAAELINSGGSQTVMPNKRLPIKILRSSSPPAELKNVRVVIKDRMKVINGEADGFAEGVLYASGNPADPTVKGKINLKPGFKINFQDNTFNVKEGLVEYKNRTVESPELFVDATTEIKDNNDPLEKTYSIRMLANGFPNDLNIGFTSQPALDEKQVVSLLTIGTVSTQSLGQEINSQEQAAYSGFQFGSYLLQRNKAVKDLKKKTGIELGVSSSLTSFGVSPKVEAKKSWTPKLSSSLSQSFGNQRNLEFKNEYKLNKKTSTVLGIENNQTNDTSQLNNRRLRNGVILDLGLQYKFEFD